jgi:serine/threonine protein kinase/WD40 repeat protein/Flp pilus assembly protein TadD
MMNDARVPETTGTESLVADVADAFMERLRRGEHPDVEDYARQYPEIAAVLRHVLPALEVIGSSAPGWSASRPNALPEIQPEAPLGDYRIVRELGRGGMGVVYQAVQISLGREVALKVLPFAAALDPKQLQRFKNEAQAAAALHHTNIVPVYGVGCERGIHYYAMQYIEGQTVAAIIAELRALSGLDHGRGADPVGPTAEFTRDLATGRLAPGGPEAGDAPLAGTGADRPPVPEEPRTATVDQTPKPAASTERATRGPAYFRTVANLGHQAATALEHAHSLGVIHRDIKPANLLVDGRGNLWITDFGLARLQGSAELTVSGDLVGTLRYMSPEQALAQRAPVDHRTDLYSLGMTLYELLTLEPAFGGRDRSELLRQIASVDPRRPRVVNKAVPSDLETIVLKAIEKLPAQRYATAQELADDLQRFLDDKPIRARRPSLWDRARKLARRHKAVVATAAVAGVLLLVAVGVVATVAAFRLRELLDETRKAQTDGQRRLYESRLAEAKASRWSGRAGRRFEGLSALNDAAKLARELDLGPDAVLALRHEAIACMILPDVAVNRQWEGSPPQSGAPILMAFDAGMDRYARVEPDGTVTVRGMADNAILVHIKDIGAPARRTVDWRVRLRFSPDGRFLATGSQPTSAVPLGVWDLSGPKRILTVPARGQVLAEDFDFSPDSRTLATGQADGSIGLYDVRSARLLKSLAPGSSPAGLRFDPAGQRLAVYRHSDPTIRILDLDGRPAGPILSHPGEVTATPAWHVDGQLLASGCHKELVYLWNTRTGKPVTVCKGQSSDPINVAFGHGGDLLVSSNWNGITRLWDPRSGRQLVSADGWAIAFSRDDRWLARELSGPYVGRWEVATGHECRSLWGGAGAQDSLHSMDIDRDGRVLAAAANDGVHLWDLSTGKEAQLLRIGPTFSVIFDPSGRFLVTCGCAGLYRWPTRWDPDPSASCLRVGPPRAVDLPPRCEPVQCTQSRDGQRIAIHTRTSGEAIFLDLAKPWRQPRSVRENGLWCAAVSPDGRWIVTGTWNGFACKVWEAHTSRCLQDLPARQAMPAFSPDNRWLVNGAFQEYAFHEFDGSRWQCRRQQPREKGTAFAGLVAFTADARVVALTYSGRSIQLLDTRDWRELAIISAPDAVELNWLCFSPDGSRLAAGAADGTIQLWDLRRIRARLREMGLDWDPPAQPMQPADDGQPVRVAVDAGPLLDLERESLILALAPGDAEACYRRGLAYAQRGQLGDALDDFRHALALEPDHAQAHYQRGLVLARQGKVDEAIADWSRTIALEPEHVEAYAARGGAYSSSSRWDEAAGDYARLVELRPDWPEFHNGAAWLLATHPDPRRRDAKRAVALAQRAVELDPDEGNYWNTLGVAQYRSGDSKAAIAALEKAVELEGGPASSVNTFFLAMAHWHVGEKEQAGTWYEKGVQWMNKNAPNDEELRRFRAEAERLLGLEHTNKKNTEKTLSK